MSGKSLCGPDYTPQVELQQLLELQARVMVTEDDFIRLMKVHDEFIKASITSRVVGDVGPHAVSSHLAIYARLNAEPPLRLRTIAGGIVNELRSILDSLAVVLAARAGKGPPGIYFPVSGDCQIFFRKIAPKVFRNFAAEDWNTILELRVWDDRNRYYMLHLADKVRKHHKLLGATGSSMGTHFGSAEIGVWTQEHPDLKLDKEICVGSGFGIRSDFVKPNFAVTYNEPPQLRRRVLLDFIMQSADAVLQAVNAFLPQAKRYRTADEWKASCCSGVSAAG